MEQKPTVSVVICTYNGEAYLAQQLDSILQQTYPISEIIAQDDGSTDRTMQILQQYAAKTPHMQVYQNEHNMGFNLNFKSAVMRAKGTYIAISDQDDVWLPQKIERQVQAIGGHDICFSTHLRGATMEHSHIVSPQYSLEALLFGGFAGHTMLLERTFAQTDLYWIDHIHYDWSLAINAQLRHGIVMVNEPLNWHRAHEASACAVEQQELAQPQPQKPSALAPYLHGYANYRRLQKKDNWRALYIYVFMRTKDRRFQLPHRMCRYLLSSNPVSLFKLCLICFRHRQTIYYSKNIKGLRGAIRGFFYPFIFAYNNVQYDLK